MAKKRPARQWFTLEMDPYRKNVFVCAGFKSWEEIRKVQPKGAPEWWYKFLDDIREKMEEDFRKGIAKGSCFFDDRHGAGIMILRPFDDTWEYWEVIIHECSHYLDFLGEQIGLSVRETEARAYLLEFMFRRIRRTLQGITKPWRP